MDPSVLLVQPMGRAIRHRISIGSFPFTLVGNLNAPFFAPLVSSRVGILNTGTIAAYERMGFRITGEVLTEIGGGFVMDDYAMERVL